MHTKRLNCASRTWPGRVIISALVIGCWLSAAAAEQGLVRIDVTIGKSQVIEVKERFDRVSVTDPNIADVFVITPNQILINGKAVGVTSLVVFYPQKTLFFDLVVQTDIALLQERLKQIAPHDEIEVRPAQNAIILHGAVTSGNLVSSAGEVASVFTPKGKVVNLLTVRDVKPQEVMIQVQVAEVLRSALRELGFSARLLGSTFQGAFFPGAAFFPPLGLIGAATNVVDSPTIQSPEMQFTDLANLFFSSPDRDFAGMVRAMAERDLLRVLAKPNLVTESGKKASFLSGGEFPFPVAQGGAAAGAITIEFKPFGVSLTFLPVVVDGSRINLAIEPEVSSLDFTSGLVSAGFQVPAIRKVMASTTVNLRDGESFAIAGLVNNEIRQAVAKIPLLGDIPILGALFRSVRFRNNESELLFLVTVKLVKGVPPGDPRLPDPTKLMEMTEEEKSEFTLLPGIPGVGEVVERPLGRSDL
ncbi:MAG: type II and III secretion system protein family protein [Candidatus Methylomirabilales bacterium]